MEEQENLEIDIGDLRHAYEKMQEVLNDLKDVEGLDEDYIELNEIIFRINNKSQWVLKDKWQTGRD